MTAGANLDPEVDAFVQCALPAAIASGDPGAAVADVITAMKMRAFDPGWPVEAKLTWLFVATLGHLTTAKMRAVILAATSEVESQWRAA